MVFAEILVIDVDRMLLIYDVEFAVERALDDDTDVADADLIILAARRRFVQRY